MPYVISQPCIGEKAAECVIVCPVNCIHDAGDQYVIHPDECIECGSCQTACPVDAVFRDDELPEAWKKYETVNRAFFEQKDK